MQFIIQATVFVALAGWLGSKDLQVSGLAIGVVSLLGAMLFCVVIPNALTSLWRGLLKRRVSN